MNSSSTSFNSTAMSLAYENDDSEQSEPHVNYVAVDNIIDISELLLLTRRLRDMRPARPRKRWLTTSKQRLLLQFDELSW